VEKTKSFVDSAGDDQKSPVKRIKPRIPATIAGLQYNFCKNIECSQFGLISNNQSTVKGEKKPYKFVSGGKNYPLLKCNKCGESPPLKSNHGIVSEINRISAYLEPKKIVFCPNQDCENKTVPLGTKKVYRSFGKTRGGCFTLPVQEMF